MDASPCDLHTFSGTVELIPRFVTPESRLTKKEFQKDAHFPPTPIHQLSLSHTHTQFAGIGILGKGPGNGRSSDGTLEDHPVQGAPGFAASIDLHTFVTDAVVVRSLLWISSGTRSDVTLVLCLIAGIVEKGTQLSFNSLP